MKILSHVLAVALLAIRLYAQTTTVSQTVNNPDGTPASGQAFITISAPCQSGSAYVGLENIATPKFTAGAFSVGLVPNDTCLTASGVSASAWSSGTAYTSGTYVTYGVQTWVALTASTGVQPGTNAGDWGQISTTYSVTWALANGRRWTETWFVPASPSTTSISAVRVSVVGLQTLPVPGPQGTGGGGSGSGVGATQTWAQIESGSSGSSNLVTATMTWAQIEAM